MKLLKTVRAGFASVALIVSLMLGGMEVSFALESESDPVSEFTLNSVNINTAEAEVIAELITGVGPQKARAIVDYREANGAFENIDDLRSVKGIGPGIIEKNSQVIRFN